jgi:hypothetical protein
MNQPQEEFLESITWALLESIFFLLGELNMGGNL